MEVEVKVVEGEAGASAENYPASNRARRAPVIPKGTPESISNRWVRPRVAKRVHALRVSDVVACLLIEFAGRRIVGTDRSTTQQTGGTTDRRTGPRISRCGADGRPEQLGVALAVVDQNAGVQW